MTEDKAAPYTGSQCVTGSAMDTSHFNCKVQQISCIISDKLTNFPDIVSAAIIYFKMNSFHGFMQGSGTQFESAR